jgi:hypothetical protein
MAQVVKKKNKLKRWTRGGGSQVVWKTRLYAAAAIALQVG